jgi:hypothetical protein
MGMCRSCQAAREVEQLVQLGVGQSHPVLVLPDHDAALDGSRLEPVSFGAPGSLITVWGRVGQRRFVGVIQGGT